ncbi:exodeoxyribonuclease X [Salmonella enterica]|nr:exodeoxyribonuclease X [Salmonella enterica]
MLRIIDTETCGLQGGIVEIASVDVIDDNIVNPMSHLIRPDRPITPQAMAIHRITEAMVADKPWIEDVIPLYYGSEWYVAHNASFDRRVLPELPGEWICTMKLSRRLWPGIKYSNMALYKSRKLSVQTPPGLHHHRALYDCYITAALLIDIMQTTGWTAEEMVNITGRPALLTTFPFGKYRGKAVSEVAKRDPGYLRWLFNNLDNMSPELRLTLKHYLEDVQAGEQRSNGTPQ